MQGFNRTASRCAILVLLVVALGTVAAQEPQPSTPGGTATGPEPASSPPPGPPPARVVLLPVEFSVYEKGMGSGEIVADWTQAARANLGTAAVEVLGERAGLQLVPMPELSPQEQQALREHIALVKLVVLEANDLTGAVWQTRRGDYDRRFGDGLQFLRDKSGADFAIVIDGAQLKQSGGSVFAQIAMAALGVAMPGGGTYLSSSLLDLGNGEVKWFNAKFGAEVLGISGSDIRTPEESKAMLRKLFEPYPAIPALVQK